MSDQPIDLETLRQIDAQIDALLEKYPELREPNPARQQALDNWLQDHLQEDTNDATEDDK